LLRGLRNRRPPATSATSSTRSATSSERRGAQAKPISSRARPRRPRTLRSQVATSRRSDSAAAFLHRTAVGAQHPLQRLLDAAV
jgi:hypothetical protein